MKLKAANYRTLYSFPGPLKPFPYIGRLHSKSHRQNAQQKPYNDDVQRG